MDFLEKKNSFDILVRNHLGIPLLAKVILCLGFFKVDYGKPLAIIEGYNTGSVIHFKRLLHYF